MEVMVGSLRGMGYAVFPMIVSLIGSCALRIVWLQIVFQIERFHNIGTVYGIYSISWIVTAMAHIITYIVVKRKLIKQYKEESLENLSDFLEVLFRIKRYDTDT